jgi:proteasome lid subunit RPN8/RPN11
LAFHVDDEIQFGEVEQAAPNRALRPEQNRHFSVVAYGEARSGELPIYVDLDVLADMEDHALTDTSVELGGVLLGGCYEDDQGRPFVVITDSLRAEHYESTKGSFKFTHDTWAAITRQREQFRADMQMVGWYHTHPDWGVFLSGMDMFICDNFFNKKLDVAYVIDPCRGDRGMFQWTDDPRHRVRRTGGFFVTASRFRAAELEHYVAELCSAMPLAPTTRASAGSYPAPVVHLHQPRSPEPPWQGIAIASGLALQFVLMAMIAWKVLTPATAERPTDTKIVDTLDKLNASLGALETRRKADLAEARAKARSEFLDEAFRELKGADEGAISRLQSRFDQTARLSEDLAARDAEIRELRFFVEDARGKISELEAAGQRDEKRLSGRIDDLKHENAGLQADLKKKNEELASLRPKKSIDKTAAGETDKSHSSIWWWTAAGALTAVLLVAGVWWATGRGLPPAETGGRNDQQLADTTDSKKE